MVVVEMDRWVVFVEVIAELRRIPLLEEILDIDVPDHHMLVAALKRVQAAIGVFLQHVEVSAVVFDPVGAKVAEKSDAGLFIGKDKAAEIGIELLDAGAYRNEVVV